MLVRPLASPGRFLGLVLAGLVAWAAGCDAPTGTGPAAPPEVRFIPIASFDGVLLGTWSPVGQTLLFNGNDGVMAYDAEHPGSEPWEVRQELIASMVWAPDGTWILFKLPREIFFVSPVYAVPLAGGTEVKLVERAGSYRWASNGRIYYWEETGERRRIDPPPGWTDTRPKADADFHLVGATEPQSRYLALHVFSSIPVESEWLLTGFETEGTSWISGEDVFPDGRRFLLSSSHGARGVYSLVVDREGDKLVEFDGTTAYILGAPASSVSSDGRYVVGVDMEPYGSGVESSKLQLRHAAATWSAPIEGAPEGMRPLLSRHGLLLAFQGLDGLLHVGRLEIGPARSSGER